MFYPRAENLGAELSRSTQFAVRNTERNTGPMHGRSESPLAAARASAENMLSNLKEKAESAAKEFSELASLSCISLRKDIPAVFSNRAAKSGAGSADLSDDLQALALHALCTLHTLHALHSTHRCPPHPLEALPSPPLTQFPSKLKPDNAGAG